MKMMMPCETVTKFLLPALRTCIAKDLAEKYKFNQNKIAAILGVTQPVVSKYLSGKCDEKISFAIKDSKIKKTSEEIIKMVIENKVNVSEVSNIILKSCSQLLKEYPNGF